MIILNLGEAKEVDERADALGRHVVGWHLGMTPAEVYSAGRGAWRFGERAKRERYALLVAHGRVRLAVEITGITEPDDDGRRSIEGRILGAGNDIHDRYVGGLEPSGSKTRNPIRYWEPRSTGLCRCGCGGATDREWLPGHDQRALHEAIARRFRTVSDFLEWYEVQP